jgi:hypothetical protein
MQFVKKCLFLAVVVGGLCAVGRPTEAATLTPTPTLTMTMTLMPTVTVSQTSTVTPTSLPADFPTFESGSFVFPDPARGDTACLAFSLPESGTVTLGIFNSVGNPAAQLKEWREPGLQGWTFHIGSYAPGVYYYQLKLKSDSGSDFKFSIGKFRVIR